MLLEIRRDVPRLRAAAEERLFAMLVELTRPFIDKLPPAEITAWVTKEGAAHRYVAGTATQDDQELLGAEAAHTGETLDQLANKIIANADMYKTAAAELTGIRRRITKELTDATTLADVEAAMARAESLALDFATRYASA